MKTRQIFRILFGAIIALGSFWLVYWIGMDCLPAHWLNNGTGQLPHWWSMPMVATLAALFIIIFGAGIFIASS